MVWMEGVMEPQTRNFLKGYFAWRRFLVFRTFFLIIEAHFYHFQINMFANFWKKKRGRPICLGDIFAENLTHALEISCEKSDPLEWYIPHMS